MYSFSKKNNCNVCGCVLENTAEFVFQYKGDTYNYGETAGNLSPGFNAFSKSLQLIYLNCHHCGCLSLHSPIFSEEILSTEFFSSTYNHFVMREKDTSITTKIRLFLIKILSGKPHYTLLLYKIFLYPLFNRLRIPKHYARKRHHADKLSFLDIGHGSGIYVNGFAYNGFDSYGIDPFAPPPKGLKGTFIKDEFLNHNFGDMTFDVIYLKSVFYVLVQPEQYFKKILQLLKPNGNLIIMDSLYCHDYTPENVIETGVGPRGRQYVYDLEKMKAYLEQIGFKIISCDKFVSDYFRLVKKLKYNFFTHITGIIADYYYNILTNKATIYTITLTKK